jgi:DNA-binding NtrC family response regulator
VSDSDKPLRILIVDDNQELRTMLSEILERSGYGVQSTDKAKDALSIIERGQADLVLLDLKMPAIGGFDLLKLIRRRHLPIPVIVVSAHISQEVAKELAVVGIQGMIAKPFKKDRMTEEIERVIKQHITG